jgi:phosphoribosyl 1,2-cyclic phosphodiesterase
VKALLCGVRGSTAAPGLEFTVIGGHTSCVAVPVDAGRWLVLDAGTGLRRLGPVLGDRALCGSILLTHLHWDHTQGLPFLANADRRDAEVEVWVPSQGPPADPLSVLARGMSPPQFPITPDELKGAWTFRSMEPGGHIVEGVAVTAGEIAHKGGRTFGYRLERNGGSLAYLPDHCPSTASTEHLASARMLIDGVDLLLHGAGYLASERVTAEGFGHAVIDDVLELALSAGVGHLVLIHHAPARTDEEVAEIERTLEAPASDMRVTVGREGMWVDSGASGPIRRR